jgi:hypothetical protein
MINEGTPFRVALIAIVVMTVLRASLVADWVDHRRRRALCGQIAMFNFDFRDMLNFDFWDKEWPLVTGAPHILFWAVVIVILVILLAIVIVRWGYSREIAGLKAENAALRERLSLAHDAHAMVAQQVDTLTKQAGQLSHQIAQNDTIAHLAYTGDTVIGTVLALSNTNNALARLLTPTPVRHSNLSREGSNISVQQH